jgi:translation elongation factor EF-4
MSSTWGSCTLRQAWPILEDTSSIPNHVVQEIPTGSLYAGQCGYITCNMKESAEAHIGDTLHIQGAPVEAMPGFQPAKAMVVSTGHDLYQARGSYTMGAVRRRLSRGQRRLSQARGSAEAAHFD